MKGFEIGGKVDVEGFAKEKVDLGWMKIGIGSRWSDMIFL